MYIKLTSLNMRSLRDRSKSVHLLRSLLSLGLDVTAIQKTHFICEVEARMLSSDFVYSEYVNQLARGDSLSKLTR